MNPSFTLSASVMLPPRGAFYGPLFLLGLLQFIVALNVPSHDPANSPYLSLFTTTCALVGLFTFICVAVLLGFGSSEVDNKNILTRVGTQLTSLGLLSFLWLWLGVFLTINAKNECDRHTIACDKLWKCVIMAFLMSLLALCSAATVAYSVKVTDLPYNSHVEYARERAIARRRQRTKTNSIQRSGRDMAMSDVSPTRPPLVYAAGRARSALPV